MADLSGSWVSNQSNARFNTGGRRDVQVNIPLLPFLADVLTPQHERDASQLLERLAQAQRMGVDLGRLSPEQQKAFATRQYSPWQKILRFLGGKSGEEEYIVPTKTRERSPTREEVEGEYESSFTPKVPEKVNEKYWFDPLPDTTEADVNKMYKQADLLAQKIAGENKDDVAGIREFLLTKDKKSLPSEAKRLKGAWASYQKVREANPDAPLSVIMDKLPPEHLQDILPFLKERGTLEAGEESRIQRQENREAQEENRKFQQEHTKFEERLQMLTYNLHAMDIGERRNERKEKGEEKKREKEEKLRDHINKGVDDFYKHFESMYKIYLAQPKENKAQFKGTVPSRADMWSDPKWGYELQQQWTEMTGAPKQPAKLNEELNRWEMAFPTPEMTKTLMQKKYFGGGQPSTFPPNPNASLPPKRMTVTSPPPIPGKAFQQKNQLKPGKLVTKKEIDDFLAKNKGETRENFIRQLKAAGLTVEE